MAKELPYFKFEPAVWDSGNIQMCSRESKGNFIDLCSLYWLRLGELPYALALQKLFNGNKDALKELLEYDIIQVDNGQIVISFLDEQLSEFNIISEERRKSALKRWSDAKAMQVHNKSNAIREDKIREDKKREEKISVLPFFSDEFNNAWSDWQKHRKELKKKLTPSTEKKQLDFLGGRPENEAIAILEQSMMNGWTGLFEIKNKVNGTTKKEQQNRSNIEAFAKRVIERNQGE